MKRGKFPTSAVARALTYLVIFLPAAFGFLFVYLFGVNFIFSDEWVLVRDLRELSAGTLTLGDLFAQHNQHRIFFPRLVILSLASITDYNTVVEMYLVEICFLAVLVALLLVFRNNVGANLLFFIPVAFLVFSPEQYENMLQGFQLTFIFPQTFGVLTFFLIYLWGRGRFEKLTLPGAVGSATVASFSSIHGLMVWPAGLLQLFISPARRPAKRLAIGLWALIGVAEWIIYLIGFKGGASAMFYALENPLRGADYFLSVLGGSLFWQHAYAAVFGALLICLATASLFLIYRAGKLGESSFWIALLLFSFLTLALITAGRTEYAFVRAGVGIEQALISRYTTYSILAVIGVYVMLLKLAADRGFQITTALAGALLGLILVSLPAYYAYGLEKGEALEARRERLAFVLATYESQPDKSVKDVHVQQASVVRNLAPTLQKLDYNVFSERAEVLPPRPSSLSSVSASTRSNISIISGKEVNNQSQPVTISKETPFVRISGWAVDSRARKAAGGVYINIDGELFPAFYGTGSESLANRLNVSAYRNSGFRRAIPTSEIGTGTHQLSLVVLTNDREGYYQSDQKVTFKVR